MRMVKVLLVLLFLVLFLTAAYQNITPIKGKTITLGLDLTHYVGKWQTQPIPLGFVIVACFFGGALLMVLVNIPVWYRCWKRTRDLERELAARLPAGAGGSSVPSTLASSREDEDESNERPEAG